MKTSDFGFASFGVAAIAAFAVMLPACSTAPSKVVNPYAEYVWPKPPDKARIQMVGVVRSRSEVETSSVFQKILADSSQSTVFDRFKQPFGVDWDREGRLLVTDPYMPGLVRIDLRKKIWDVFGTRGETPLRRPSGIAVGPDGVIYVADLGQQKIVVFGPDGGARGTIGTATELTNPVDSAVSADGKRLYVSDSKAHQIVVYDLATRALMTKWGRAGSGEGELAFPAGLAVDSEGNLLVVDSINARIVIFTPEGEFLDSFGSRGLSLGAFARPKDLAVDEAGYIYVTDALHHTVQIFKDDLSLLSWIGGPGDAPDRFQDPIGIAVRGNDIAVVDSVRRRVVLFRYIVGKTEP